MFERHMHEHMQKKPKSTYCLFTYFLGFYNYRGMVTINNIYHGDEDSANFADDNTTNVRRKKSKAVVSTVD
jgi:hypothetical protein